MNNVIVDNIENQNFINTLVEIIRQHASEIKQDSVFKDTLTTNTQMLVNGLISFQSGIRQVINVPFGGLGNLVDLRDNPVSCVISSDTDLVKVLEAKDPLIDKICNEVYKHLLYFKLNDPSSKKTQPANKEDLFESIRGLISIDTDIIKSSELKVITDTIFLLGLIKARIKDPETKPTSFSFTFDNHEFTFEPIFGHSDISYNAIIQTQNSFFDENCYRLRISNGNYLSGFCQLFYKTFNVKNYYLINKTDVNCRLATGVQEFLYKYTTIEAANLFQPLRTYTEEGNIAIKKLSKEYKALIEKMESYKTQDTEENIHYKITTFINNKLFNSDNPITYWVDGIIKVKQASNQCLAEGYKTDNLKYSQLFKFNLPIYREVTTIKPGEPNSLTSFELANLDVELNSDGEFKVYDNQLRNEVPLFVSDKIECCNTINLYNALVIKEACFIISQQFKNVLSSEESLIRNLGSQ